MNYSNDESELIGKLQDLIAEEFGTENLYEMIGVCETIRVPREEVPGW